ncbi:MAG: outer membrane homotrimeric porin [Desulfovibrio sp.]|nr:outer membrane homotrimeric porin [Desulfovibrio sp.]
MVAFLAAGMLLGVQTGAKAIDFKAQGEWIVGFGVGDGNLTSRNADRSRNNEDQFQAAQRVRLQLDAVASEALSGTVYFEIGTYQWGKADKGMALGGDGTQSIKVKNAYIDWAVPQTDLKVRMGLQAVLLPNAAGGSAILDADGAAVTANYKFNDNVGLTAMWLRPANDNYIGWKDGNNNTRQQNYLDNIDLFMLSLPLTFDGIEVTPWAMYGMLGKNALDGINYDDDGSQAHFNRVNNPGDWSTEDGELSTTLTSWGPNLNATEIGRTKKSYGSMFWAGLPVTLTLWDPLNIEFDINYGFVESMGNYWVDRRNSGDFRRASSQRQGWLVKALVEYKFDWGVPGVFGWYASGDDGNVKNGSERMPSLAGAGGFTSFMGYGGIDWAVKDGLYEWVADFSGTWGVGLQVRDVSFIEDLSHTFRVALWGGTNSPSMVKYMASKDGWKDGGINSPYLTTNDNLLEFNLDNEYQMYENFKVNLDLGYVVNMIDSGTWNRSYLDGRGPNKQDAWKAQVAFTYSF